MNFKQTFADRENLFLNVDKQWLLQFNCNKMDKKVKVFKVVLFFFFYNFIKNERVEI